MDVLVEAPPSSSDGQPDGDHERRHGRVHVSLAGGASVVHNVIHTQRGVQRRHRRALAWNVHDIADRLRLVKIDHRQLPLDKHYDKAAGAPAATGGHGATRISCWQPLLAGNPVAALQFSCTGKWLAVSHTDHTIQVMPPRVVRWP